MRSQSVGREAEELQGDRGRHRAGEIGGELARAALDEPVDVVGDPVLDPGCESLDRVRREHFAEHAPQRVPLRRVELLRIQRRDPQPADAQRADLGIRTARRERLPVAERRRDLGITGDDPVAAVRVGPRDRALLAQRAPRLGRTRRCSGGGSGRSRRAAPAPGRRRSRRGLRPESVEDEGRDHRREALERIRRLDREHVDRGGADRSEQRDRGQARLGDRLEAAVLDALRATARSRVR